MSQLPAVMLSGGKRDVTDSVVEWKGPQSGRGGREPRTEDNAAGGPRS